MKTLTKRIFAIAGVLALGLTAARAQSDSALLDALVKKGVLSDQEAKEIRTDDAKEYATTPAGKLSMGDYIKNLTFYGDGRLRFDSYAQNNYNSNSKNVNDRFRYRVRLGADYTYSDNLKAGVELTSGTADDTANQTLGSTFTDASINVGRIYIQYAPTDWLTLTGGKFANPWYTTTDMTWSNDLNPEGAAEIFSWTIPLGGSVVSDPKDLNDPKAIPHVASDSSITIGLNAMQYLYVDSNQGTQANGNGIIQSNNNIGIIGNQIPVTWKIKKDFSAKVAPGFTFYTGGGNTDYQGGVPTNYTNAGTPPGPISVYGTANSSSDPVFVSPREADDLNIVSVPGEVDFKIGKVAFRPYWDFNWNVTGKQRVQSVYLDGGGTYGAAANTTTATTVVTSVTGVGKPALTSVTSTTTAPLIPTATNGYGSVAPNGKPASTVAAQNSALGDNLAWAVGLQIGQNKKKGDISGLAEFRQIGLGAVDPNINGTDFANSYSNVEGLKFAAAYNFTDFLTGTVTFYQDWAYKNNLYNALGGAGTNTAPTAGTTQYLVSAKAVQRVQVDLGWKF